MKRGEISDLECQKMFVLLETQYENGKCVEQRWTYTADFVYKDKNGRLVVEDVKGYRGGDAYRLFVHCRKMMRWRYHIEVVEV